MTHQPMQSTLLPKPARDELVAASKIRDDLMRRVAVHQATERAVARYPQYFQVPNQPEQSK